MNQFISQRDLISDDDVLHPEQIRIEKILQSYPRLSPRTLFPSFDYVEKPYAAYLDSLASIFILWAASSILIQCIQAVYGRTTKSLALKDLSDRILGLKIAKLWGVRNGKMLWSGGNLRLWLIALLSFLLLLGIDALVVYSQTTTTNSRALDNLSLRRLTLRPSEDNRSLDGGQGCLLLVSRIATSDSIPLYYCTVGFSIPMPESITSERLDIYFEVLEDRFFQISTPRPTDYFITKVSIQLRDVHSSTFYYANLTSWNFSLSVELVRHITDKLNVTHPKCNPESRRFNENGVALSIEKTCWIRNVSVLALTSAVNMIDVSESMMQSRDFIFDRTIAKAPSRSVLTSTTSESVKRLSGIILWIIAGVLELVRRLCTRLTWDINSELDEMMARILDLPPPEFLNYGSGFSFEIVERNGHDLDDDNGSYENDRKHQDVYIRRRN